MTHWHNIRPQSDDAQGINKLFIGSLRLMKTKLTRFPPSCRVNLLGHVFLKGINHYCLHFSFLLVFFFFLKMMYSQNDETGIFEILEIQILFAAILWLLAEMFHLFTSFGKRAALHPRHKLMAVNHNGYPKKRPQKWSREIFFKFLN